MVYDNTIYRRTPTDLRTGGPSGFSIHDSGESSGDEHRYAIYSDDGKGNGDYIAGTSDLFWARNIAHGLDFVGNWPTPPAYRETR